MVKLKPCRGVGTVATLAGAYCIQTLKLLRVVKSLLALQKIDNSTPLEGLGGGRLFSCVFCSPIPSIHVFVLYCRFSSGFIFPRSPLHFSKVLECLILGFGEERDLSLHFLKKKNTRVQVNQGSARNAVVHATHESVPRRTINSELELCGSRSVLDNTKNRRHGETKTQAG